MKELGRDCSDVHSLFVEFLDPTHFYYIFVGFSYEFSFDYL